MAQSRGFTKRGDFEGQLGKAAEYLPMVVLNRIMTIVVLACHPKSAESKVTDNKILSQ